MIIQKNIYTGLCVRWCLFDTCYTEKKKKIVWIKQKFVVSPKSTAFIWFIRQEWFSFVSTQTKTERNENYFFQTIAACGWRIKLSFDSNIFFFQCTDNFYFFCQRETKEESEQDDIMTELCYGKWEWQISTLQEQEQEVRMTKLFILLLRNPYMGISNSLLSSHCRPVILFSFSHSSPVPIITSNYVMTNGNRIYTLRHHSTQKTVLIDLLENVFIGNQDCIEFNQLITIH